LDSDAIRGLLLTTRRIALVGASANPMRPSYGVMSFLLGRGYDVVPVNPGIAGREVHGCRVVATLDEAVPLDLVDLFRNSAHVLAPVRDAIRLGARSIWMQLGVANEQAAGEARAAGLAVVVNRCPKIEWYRLGLPARIAA
jgi:predicted CoA-binding protein